MIKNMLPAAILAVLVTGPALAQTVPAANTSTSHVEQAIVTYFVKDSVGDVQLGRLGARRGHLAAVKRLGETMVADHTRTALQALALGKQLNADEAKLEASEENAITYAKLAAQGDAAFDKEWTKDIVDAHKADIELIHKAMAVTKNSALKSYEKSSLMIDEKHLRMAEAAQQQLGD